MIDGLNAFDLARVCQVGSSTADAWLNDEERPSSLAISRLRLVHSVMTGLRQSGLEAPEDRAEWLRNPNRAFGQEAPIDLISRDEAQQVLDYIARLR
jgi:hypothetical protein